MTDTIMFDGRITPLDPARLGATAVIDDSRLAALTVVGGRIVHGDHKFKAWDAPECGCFAS